MVDDGEDGKKIKLMYECNMVSVWLVFFVWVCDYGYGLCGKKFVVMWICYIFVI